MTIIKSKTGQLFIPTVVQGSPINPQQEMLIIMRSIERLDKYQIDREAIIDDSRLAKSYVLREFQFMSSDLSEWKNQLSNQLT